MSRVWNFSAGPAVLPEEVLREAAAEMLDWHGSGMSVMEMSHRGKEFTSIIEQAEADLRELLAIPEHFKVLFMQGGAIAQNALVPLNLLGGKTTADYVVNGSWSAKSYREAQRYCTPHLAAGALAGPFRGVPPAPTFQLSADPAYLFICSNETIDGVEYAEIPDLDALGRPGVPLVADVSSHILSRRLDWRRYGLVFGGAQKNIGSAGLTLVVVRDDLLDRASPLCPSAFEYKTVAANRSMYNTPPTYAIYIAGLVFQWLKRQGGVAAIESINIAKARLLYAYLDGSGFYGNCVEPEYRSRMNVPFFLKNELLNELFLAETRAAGLVQLKGHKSVGGMRASLYNAMPIEGVVALVDFMKEFARRHG
ncbi:MAG: 3-phosphoserine/phosphohydroxythreonine transaminase [Betaproteobacteria bacterium HGW-Betaproteobacteria-11]|nr:MAG: 3-phosphoserine/phosphohydroxythreonine transaminase [Betaproteobacteria bacterium HGW-Betaproteobacteria-11]